METNGSRYDGVKGTVSIGAFDFAYNDHNWIVRGNFDYGHLSDSYAIKEFNMNMSNASPSSKQLVASDAIAAGIEAGFDLFSLSPKLHQKEQRFYLYGRYDYYDSMYKMERNAFSYDWCGRQRVAAGINYYPIRDIVIKGEYAIGLLRSKYNNEPSISLGVAYSGLFL